MVRNNTGADTRRSVLKKLSAASLGSGALVVAGSGTASASHVYQACDNPTYVYRDCDEYPNYKGEADLYSCGTKEDECTTPNGRKMLYIEWDAGSHPEGWVYRDSLCLDCS